MIEALYKKMAVPESCRLGKRIYKRLFHENAKLSATDKKALSDDIDTIFWQYTFKPTTIPIRPYQDDQREYHEVALIQINLKQIDRVNRLAEIVHRAIPYPLIIVFTIEQENSQFSLSLAYKRFSQLEKEAIVAEGFQATDWLDLSNPTKYQVAFLESLNISTWPHTHFLAFYRAAMDRVVALACAEHSGQYSLGIPNGHSVDDRINKLKQVEKFQQEKSELQGKLKKDKNLGSQIELNTRIKQIKDHIEAIKNEL